MGNLFSHQKKKNSSSTVKGNSISSSDRAILDLKNARDRLKKYQGKLTLETATLLESAKTLMKAGKKDRAMLALKMKKYKEQQIEKASAQLLTVFEMVETIEWETQQLRVFEGLKAGNAALDAIHKEMSVLDVEELMLETAEAQETANEISRLIGGSLSAEDEDEVLAELAEIERAELDALSLEMPNAPNTPLDVTSSNQDHVSSAENLKSTTKEKELIAA